MNRNRALVYFAFCSFDEPNLQQSKERKLATIKGAGLSSEMVVMSIEVVRLVSHTDGGFVIFYLTFDHEI